MAAPLAVFRHGEFVGRTQRSRILSDIALSHRVAAGEVEPHTHEDVHFVWVTGGRYRTSARGAAPPDGEPLLVFNPAGTAHRDHFADGTGSFFAISVSSDRARMLSEGDLPSSAIHVANRRARDVARALLQDRWDEPCAPMHLEALVVELLDATATVRRREVRNPPPWLMRAREMLHDCCADDLALRSVAAQAGVHPIHLTRSFRDFFFCTPGEFLRSCRLERAAALLNGSRMPLSAVALASGFADQSHLTRRFRARFGLPPGRYRALTSRRD